MSSLLKLKELSEFHPSAKAPSDISSTVYMSTEGYRKLVDCKDGKNLYWTTDVNCELPIKMGTTGPSATIQPDTIPNAFIARANQKKKGLAMKVMRGKKEYSWNWNQYLAEVMAFAKSLEHLGIDQRKCVNIMGFNSPEWAIAFFGSIFHNNPVSGVYITNGAGACKYQAEHSEAQAIICDNEK